MSATCSELPCTRRLTSCFSAISLMSGANTHAHQRRDNTVVKSVLTPVLSVRGPCTYVYYHGECRDFYNMKTLSRETLTDRSGPISDDNINLFINTIRVRSYNGVLYSLYLYRIPTTFATPPPSFFLFVRTPRAPSAVNISRIFIFSLNSSSLFKNNDAFTQLWAFNCRSPVNSVSIGLMIIKDYYQTETNVGYLFNLSRFG